jgi:hypothetical protein
MIEVEAVFIVITALTMVGRSTWVPIVLLLTLP